jgi:lysophospholipase L1-like esterase
MRNIIRAGVESFPFLNQNNSSDWKRFLARLGVTGGLIILFLEGALWLFHPLPRLPHAVRRVFHQNITGLRPEIIYERNMFGLRSVTLNKAETKRKDSRTIRIICIGASTTDQQTQNTEDTWSAILEKRLQEELSGTGSKIEVAAFGRGGFTVFDNSLWSKENLLSLSPDLVITLLGINDLTLSGGPDYTYPSSERTLILYEDFIWSRCPLWEKVLITISQTYRHVSMIRHRLRVFQALKTGRALEWHSEHLSVQKEDYRNYPYVGRVHRSQDPIKEFEDGLSELLEFLHANQITTVVLAQPVLWKKKMSQEELDNLWLPVATEDGFVRPDPEWLEQEMGRYNRIQEKRAELNGAFFVPLDKLVPKTTEVFFDDCHFTDTGSQIVAELVYPTISERIRNIIEEN